MSPAVKLHAYAGSDTNVLRLHANADHNPGSASEAVSCTSDIRLKANIRDAPPALDEMLKFRIRQFEVKANNETNVGVIAQELLPLLPEYVSLGDDGYYKAGEVSPWKLVKALQELKQENEELKAKLDDADRRLAALSVNK